MKQYKRLHMKHLQTVFIIPWTFILCLTLITSTYDMNVYALQRTTTTTLQANTIESPIATRRQLRDEVLKAANTIVLNRTSIKAIVEDSRLHTKEVKKKINYFKNHLDDLSKEDLNIIKLALTEIKLYDTNNRTYLKSLSDYNRKIIRAREEKDFTKILILYHEILTLQETHIETLKNYIHILEDLLAI